MFLRSMKQMYDAFHPCGVVRPNLCPMKIIECKLSNDVLEYNTKGANVYTKSLSKEYSLVLLFKRSFLPIGYPHTVSSDYINYQYYDTLQAFCSSFIGMLATRSMLHGFGVGDSNSSVLNALLTWTLRDGVQMVSRIVFAFKYSNKFTSDLKSWRYAADFLNDFGYALDFIAASFNNKKVFTVIASFSVIFKTMTSVAGGATKTALTNHFAINGNMADLDAKDGSQETLVNLIGMIIGSYFIQFVPLENLWIWIIFLFLGFLHLYFNYLAISAVVLHNVNRTRAQVLLDDYIQNLSISSPKSVAGKESLFFCNDSIRIGDSIKRLKLRDQLYVIKSFQNQDTVIVKDGKVRLIFIRQGSNKESIMKAYLTALLDKTGRMVHVDILDKFLIQLLESGWTYNVSDLDLIGYEYYKPS